ncbi:MAG: hypothetical protein ACTS9Y_06490 [Methylophilus sp.]|uniref:hypothetical protein n=1 Tax=Methylophilus sp. TaxID=29541 RepID=UPI003FA029F1
MIPIYTPQTESEVAVISSMLDAYEIPYFIRGGAFSKLYPGLQIKDYNTQTVMVPAEFQEVARELLIDFIQPQPQAIKRDSKASISRIFRVCVEMILAGWVFTGKRWNKNAREDKLHSDE